jgi:ribosomal protein S18 acetylase RimI-like enzyme
LFALLPPLTARLVDSEDSADELILRRLYADSREDLNDLPLPPEQKEQLLLMQMRAHQHGLQHTFPMAQNWLVMLNEVVVGRFIIELRDGDLRLIDLVILREYRQRQIASQLLSAFKSYAVERELSLSLAVSVNNVKARKLYEQHGFCVVAEDGIFAQMCYNSSPI